MKNDTRQKILDTARELFNKYGYNSVSLRDVAKEVGISEGNLTYHFSKKEKLIESLLTVGEDTLPPGVPQTLEELDAVFLDQELAVRKNLYFFMNYTQLAQTSPEICRKQSARYGELMKKFRLAFQSLRSAGLLRGEDFPGEYDAMADALYISLVYWAPFTDMKETLHLSAYGGEPNKEREDYRRYAWRCVHHLLTERGRDELRKIVSL